MRGIAVLLGTIIILVLLVSSGVFAGAFCVRGIGCIYSDANGLQLNNAQQVTIGTADAPRP